MSTTRAVGSRLVARPMGADTTTGWSHRCVWDELVEPTVGLGGGINGAPKVLDMGTGWVARWTVTWRYAGDSVTSPVRSLGSMPVAGCQPVRRFSWSRQQRHRPGLQYLVSTDRLHGYESLEEARLLLVLDFAAGLVDVISQPFRLRFFTVDGNRDHVPDFLAYTRTGPAGG